MKQKGFTLIELLVVIAIIAILAGILLVAIDPGAQIDKANDAKAQAGLAGIPVAAAIFYDDNGYTYAGLCEETAVDAVETRCGDGASAWAAAVDLEDGSEWCVDSTGFAGLSSADLTDDTGTACTQ